MLGLRASVGDKSYGKIHLISIHFDFRILKPKIKMCRYQMNLTYDLAPNWPLARALMSFFVAIIPEHPVYRRFVLFMKRYSVNIVEVNYMGSFCWNSCAF